jgi:hypothetical protein
MNISFVHRPHSRITERAMTRPPTIAEQHVGSNGRIALALTAAVGTMWCAYAFAILALVVLPNAIGGGLLPFVQWVSQTFIHLVMLSVIMVGQNVLGRASDKRASMTYRDAEATFLETGQIQAHLTAQDAAINALLEKVAHLDASLGRKGG